MGQPSAEQFAHALTEAIYRIRHLENKSVGAVQDELGYSLGKKGGASIEYWRKGRLPAKMGDVAQLARMIVQHSDLNRGWLLHFLESAGYPEPKQLEAELFPQTEGANGNGGTAVSPASRLHNLPIELTPFIGREGELQTILRHLEDPDCRLLTLVGPGGIGKTRLAVQAARERVALFPDGIYFVPLVAVPTADLLLNAIANTLGMTVHGLETAVSPLLTHLKNKHILIILDNFEHLMDGVELVVALLQHTQHTQLLLTSSERLNLQGEWAFPLRGLPYPAEGLDDINTFSAVQLFIRSARRTRPDFELQPEDVPYIIQICQLVEGIPLGIELAASWVRLLSCQVIAAEITQSYAFLATPWRDVPERHRSLQAVFDYSWQLLPQLEQELLRKLAVFVGSFSREAAVSVADASLWTLSSLVDKSFLQHIPHSDRYELHDLLRQYALEKLNANATEEVGGTAVSTDYLAVHDRHAAYYAAKIEQLTSPTVGELLDNVRAAWQWALHRDTLKTAVALLNPERLQTP